VYSSSQGCHTATGTHMPHGITQCYLPPGRGDIPALTSAEAGTRLSDPRGMQGWVDLVKGKGKGSPYSITECRVPELIPVLGSQPAGGLSHKHGGRLPLLSARPAVTLATLKRAVTNFAAWWTEARWVWTVCLRLLPDSVADTIWTRGALLRLSPAH